MSEEQKKPEYVAENADAEADTIFGGTPAAAPAAAPKKKLSKSVRGLIIAVSALVGISVGITAVMLMRGDDAPDDSQTDSTAAESISLNVVDAENLTDIEVKGAEPFHVTRTFRGRADVASTYTIEGFEDLALDTNLLSTLANNGCALEADSLIEEQAADLGKYGLADPMADVTLTYEDGSEFQFLVGDKSPMDSSKTYCAVGGDVYLIRTSLVSNYAKLPMQFLSTTILEETNDASYPIVENLRIERQDLDWDIYMEYDHESAEDDTAGGTAATHVMLEPLFSYLNVEKSKDITNGMFGLSAAEVALVHPEEADFQKCGLDEPFCTVTMNTDDGECRVLTIGSQYDTADGKTLYYTYLDGVNEIFGVSADSAKWITVQPNDITAANIFVTNVWNIGTLEIRDKDNELTFTGEGTSQEDYVVQKNGETCDTERFRTLYRFLLFVYGEELYIGDLPDGEPDAEVHLTTQNGKEDYTISFYKVSDLKTIVARDGVPSYVIRTSALDTLSYNLSIFDETDTEFKTTWQ
ncbi:MAG: DUF4340 domain-containing protein [Oscillospiraceae bacterium]|nr:DUF4340 domain-containing protein [Oscillospiraceae bacterium]